MMIILASASSARFRLLTEAGVIFEQRNHNASEDDLPALANPSDTALHLAASKALSLHDVTPQDVVIGSDQVLEFEGRTLRKARSLDELKTQLLRLRGQRHVLHSSVVCVQERQLTFSVVSSATLTMRSFSPGFLDTYLAHYGTDVLACVGGYKIEAEGVQLFDTIAGDCFTIQGMPLLPLLAFLRSQGFMPS
jgi:septum formation protein